MKLFEWFTRLFETKKSPDNFHRQMLAGFVITDSQHYIHSKEKI